MYITVKLALLLATATLLNEIASQGFHVHDVTTAFTRVVGYVQSIRKVHVFWKMKPSIRCSARGDT